MSGAYPTSPERSHDDPTREGSQAAPQMTSTRRVLRGRHASPDEEEPLQGLGWSWMLPPQARASPPSPEDGGVASQRRAAASAIKSRPHPPPRIPSVPAFPPCGVRARPPRDRPQRTHPDLP